MEYNNLGNNENNLQYLGEGLKHLNNLTYLRLSLYSCKLGEN